MGCRAKSINISTEEHDSVNSLIMEAVILLDDSKLGRNLSGFNPSYSEPINHNSQISIPNGHNSSSESASTASGSVYQHSHSNSNPTEQNGGPVSRSDSFHSLGSQHTELSINGVCSSERSIDALAGNQPAQLILSHPIDSSEPAATERNAHIEHSNSLGINIPQPQPLFIAPLSDTCGIVHPENGFKTRRSNRFIWSQPPFPPPGPIMKRPLNGALPTRPYKFQASRGRGSDLHSTRNDFNGGFRNNWTGPFSGPGRPMFNSRPPYVARRSYGGGQRPPPPSRYSSSSAHCIDTHYPNAYSKPTPLFPTVDATVCSTVCATTPPSVDSAITSTNSRVEPRLSDEAPSSRCSVSTTSCSSACSPFHSVLTDEQQLWARFESLQRASTSHVQLGGGVEFTGCAADAIAAHLSQLKSLGLSAATDDDTCSESAPLPPLTFGFDEADTHEQSEVFPAMPSAPDVGVGVGVAASPAAAAAANAAGVSPSDLQSSRCRVATTRFPSSIRMKACASCSNVCKRFR